jgi:ankyrin repeat protein
LAIRQCEPDALFEPQRRFLKMRAMILALLLFLSLPFTIRSQNNASDKDVNSLGDGRKIGTQVLEDALVLNIKDGDAAEVKRLLDAGASPDTKDEEGWPVLFWAIHSGQMEIVRTLLEHGADPDASDERKRLTALGLAAHAGRLSVVKLLLEKGAHVDTESDCKHTPLIWATEGATIKSMWDYARQRLPQSYQSSDDESTEYRLKYPDNFGGEHARIVEILLDAGADVNAEASCETGDFTSTALMVATLGSNAKLVKLLLARGADPNKGAAVTPLELLTTGAGDMNPREGEVFSPVEETDTPEEKQVKQVANDWWQSLAPARQEIIRLLRRAGAKEPPPKKSQEQEEQAS